ncbi:MAG TPA: exopolysaccharide Pel transporter PelG [Kofleriaceae bacterium]|jgi:uncharacterized membrane protein|nr:exopolysaccharide Pel transporter PelG [Kofleriaceae bacterium]
MAGIGWRLERMIAHGSLAGSFAAYLTGAAVTSAPWLLTTVALVAMHLLARTHAGMGEFPQVEQIVTVTYAVTLVLGAPVHIVVSRYAADRLYERRPAAIAAPLYRALAMTLLGFSLVGLVTATLIAAPLPLACAVPALTVVVGGQWLLLGVGGGLCSPAVVLRAFGAGTVVSIAGAIVLERAAGLGARGFLYGFTAGQAVAMTGMLIGVLCALPDGDDSAGDPGPGPRLGFAFREYRLLAASAFASQLAMWADKLMIWLLAGRDLAVIYASAAALAWFSVIPAFAWIFVELETAFYRAFRGFYGAIEGGAGLAEVAAGAAALRREATRILHGAVAIQLVVTALVLVGSDRLVLAIDLPRAAITPFRLVALAAVPQLVTLVGMILLHYFDLRRDALVVATTHLVGCAAATAAACALGIPPGIGSVTASTLSAAIVLRVVTSRLRTLVADTFQSQPYSDELLD